MLCITVAFQELLTKHNTESLSPRATQKTGYQQLYALLSSLVRLCREPQEFDRNAMQTSSVVRYRCSTIKLSQEGTRTILKQVELVW